METASNSRHGGPSPPCPSLIHPQYRDRGFLLQSVIAAERPRQGYPDHIRAAVPAWHGLSAHAEPALPVRCGAPEGSAQALGVGPFCYARALLGYPGAGGLSRGISQAPSRSHKERTLAPSEHDESRAAGKAVTGGESPSGLRRALSARHLTMIAVGGSIGTGLFVASGATVAQAGPGRAAGLRADRHHGLFPDDQPGRAGRGHAGFRLVLDLWRALRRRRLRFRAGLELLVQLGRHGGGGSGGRAAGDGLLVPRHSRRVLERCSWRSPSGSMPCPRAASARPSSGSR